jgi:hypothetical protein
MDGKIDAEKMGFTYDDFFYFMLENFMFTSYISPLSPFYHGAVPLVRNGCERVREKISI